MANLDITAGYQAQAIDLKQKSELTNALSEYWPAMTKPAEAGLGHLIAGTQAA
ncbi:hypothetical protein VVD49_14960 [Uliginosibacterium sp. H3]|uniref:Uncharacterized protein n=1 Tax=Uliginosibacterium silvisoli TaxID=3114758 RepID=A0ABU6K5R0_9RHOO|nr:hypothetical protein [Uliginosibacterium sp. H3]